MRKLIYANTTSCLQPYIRHHTFIIHLSSYVHHILIIRSPYTHQLYVKDCFSPTKCFPLIFLPSSLLPSSLHLSLHQRSHLWPLLSSSKPFSMPIFLGSHMLIYFCLPLALEPSEGKSSASLARTFTRTACGRRWKKFVWIYWKHWHIVRGHLVLGGTKKKWVELFWFETFIDLWWRHKWQGKNTGTFRWASLALWGPLYNISLAGFKTDKILQLASIKLMWPCPACQKSAHGFPFLSCCPPNDPVGSVFPN